MSAGSSIHASGNAVDDPLVQHRVGGLVDDRAFVEALEVDRVHGAGRDERGDQLVVPGARRVELEGQLGADLEALLHRLERRRLAEAQRDHERHARRLAPERLVQRYAGLPEREVERRRLVRPRPVAPGDLALGRLGKQLEACEVLAEAGEGEAPGEGQCRAGSLEDVVILGLVGDVLADALLAFSAQRDQRRLALEVAGDRLHEAVEPVLLDLDRQLRHPLPGAHPAASCSSRATSSSSRSSSSAAPTAASSPAHCSIRRLPSLTSASVSSRLASPESRRRMISSTRAVAAS